MTRAISTDIDKNNHKELLSVKVSMPGKFVGKLDESFRAWSQDLKAYANGIHPGF